jgi:hypothetical protein
MEFLKSADSVMGCLAGRRERAHVRFLFGIGLRRKEKEHEQSTALAV